MTSALFAQFTKGFTFFFLGLSCISSEIEEDDTARDWASSEVFPFTQDYHEGGASAFVEVSIESTQLSLAELLKLRLSFHSSEQWRFDKARFRASLKDEHLAAGAFIIQDIDYEAPQYQEGNRVDILNIQLEPLVSGEFSLGPIPAPFLRALENALEKDRIVSPLPGSSDPGSSDPGSSDPGLPDPGLPDPGLPDPGLPDPGRSPSGVDRDAEDLDGDSRDSGVSGSLTSAKSLVSPQNQAETLDELIVTIGPIENISVVSVFTTEDEIPALRADRESFEKGSAVKDNAWPWWAFAGIGAFFVLSVALILFLFFRRASRRVSEVIVVSPYDWAMSELSRIRDEDILGKEGPKAFYYAITGLLREFMGRHFKMNAPHQTTQEFLQSLRHQPLLTSSQSKTLSTFLDHCDQVKYAGEQASTEECSKVFQMASQFVQQTIGNAPEGLVGMDAHEQDDLHIEHEAISNMSSESGTDKSGTDKSATDKSTTDISATAREQDDTHTAKKGSLDGV